MTNVQIRILALLLAFSPVLALAQGATFTVKQLTPETALVAAQAALKKCRDNGHQVSVAVVDRSGIAQVLLRDRFAGAHTVDTATRKAWTAAAFRTGTTDLDKEAQPGKPAAGIRQLPNVAILGGGMVIEAGGTTFGGIGVSGAPGQAADDACAKAGVAAIAESLEF
jgi:uncharacterized protein GlcG (DUF336 family)